MKYETPEMTVLTPAIKAIQGDLSGPKYPEVGFDSLVHESVATYTDWE
jgi:hypothetical protein